MPNSYPLFITAKSSSTPAASGSSSSAAIKSESASVTSGSAEETLRRTPSRQASATATKPAAADNKDVKKVGGRTDSPKPPGSPASGSRG